MSFTDRLVLWLHIGFAIFTIGPVALAISSSPRYIRRRDVPVLRYLARITLIFTTGSLLVLVFGIVLGQLDHDFDHPWLTVAMTLFVVAIVLLVLIIRDQRRAIRAITPTAATAQAAGDAGTVAAAARRPPRRPALPAPQTHRPPRAHPARPTRPGSPRRPAALASRPAPAGPPSPSTSLRSSAAGLLPWAAL